MRILSGIERKSVMKEEMIQSRKECYAFAKKCKMKGWYVLRETGGAFRWCKIISGPYSKKDAKAYVISIVEKYWKSYDLNIAASAHSAKEILESIKF